MKKLILALLFFATPAFAQLTIDCSMLKATDPNGVAVSVFCGGGTTGQPPPSGITATFLGADQDKTAGLVAGTDGSLDWHIRVSGLPATTVSLWRVDGTGTGLWVGPSNGTNWIVLPQLSGTTADLWFSQWQFPIPFTLTITFSDGTSSVISGIK